ncbi:MAG: helix-turn-helix transcriptional regulator [Ruminococcaceae bacterium]|nr:helix-turn-helix transcriptional regulator [Oscillospiraceae bacterium]
MDISYLNPYIRYSKLHRVPFFLRTEPSVCYDCRLFYFTNTDGTLFTGNEKYKITNNTAVFLPPETVYKITIDFQPGYSMAVFNFDLTQSNNHLKTSLGTVSLSQFNKKDVPPYALCSELSSVIVREIPKIEPTLIKCTENFILKNEYYKDTSSALLKLCLLEIIKNDSHVSHSDLCNRVLKFISENFKNPGLTNEEIASFFNYHPYHLSNIIKKETGKTLHQFLIYYKLRYAKELLAATDYDISHIAWQSGFQTPAHFTYTFRQNVGITPKDYRKQHSGMVF